MAKSDLCGITPKFMATRIDGSMRPPFGQLAVAPKGSLALLERVLVRTKFLITQQRSLPVALRSISN